jgi:preprotein translocase subunit SecB
MAKQSKSQDGEGAEQAQETKTVEPVAAEPGAAAAGAGKIADPQIQMVSQYVKDLSFENPGIGRQVKTPKVELAVDIQANRGQDPSHYEVVLKLRATATDETAPMFIVELAYGAFIVLKNVPDDLLQQVLLIEIPRQIFPFARRIISDVTRDGGMLPLMLEPIDFVAIYRRKMAEAAGQKPMVS